MPAGPSSIFPFLGRVLRDHDRLVGQARPVLRAVCERVLQPVPVVASREVVAPVGAPALLPGQGPADDDLAELEQVSELDGFEEIRVETGPLVLDPDFSVPVLKVLDYREPLL